MESEGVVTPATVNARVLWEASVKKVSTAVGVSKGFKTLRDMAAEAFITPEHLKKVRKLGEGAFAVVDQCNYQKEDGSVRPVAVKRLKPEAFENEEDLESFLTETKLMRKMRHSCVVDFMGVGLTDAASLEELKKNGTEAQEKVYLVQEYMDRGTLKGLVLKQMLTPLRPVYSHKQGMQWCLQVAKGLQYLHDSKPKIIHRDVKMENVFLRTNEAGEIVAKLGDFGLCAIVDHLSKSVELNDASRGTAEYIDSLIASSMSSSNLTKLQKAAAYSAYELSGKTGSLMYMAPEVLLCEKYSEKCDIFSLGMVIYEVYMRTLMLTYVSCTGEPDEIEKYAQAIAYGSRPILPDSVPEKLRDLIKLCWISKPEYRPTAGEVVRELEAMIEENIFQEPEKAPSCACCLIQ